MRKLLKRLFIIGGSVAAPDIMVETAVESAFAGSGPVATGQDRLSPLQSPPPKGLAIGGTVLGVVLMASRVFLSSTLGTVLFFVGLGLLVFAPVTYAWVRSERVLTDSTTEARHIARTGIPAVATLTGARYTNSSHGSAGTTADDRPVYELDLTITPPDPTPPYRVQKELAIATGLSGRLVPGLTFEVRIDPNHPSRVVLP